MTAFEANVDGLVGPTHNYAGLAFGNLASQQNAAQISNPLQAVKQGLHKMKCLHDLGLPQFIMPPQARPNFALLKQWGFSGSDEQKLKKAYQQDPALLAQVFSASSMWTANAATVSPSADTADGKVHFTPANLFTYPHRQQEAEFTGKLLSLMFADPEYFRHHPPLDNQYSLRDEGAANHNRLCVNYDDPGIEMFVFGQDDQQAKATTRYPARQSLLASQTISQQHQLQERQTVFVQQNPLAIDQGVFHNDVIAVANQHVLLIHQQAWFDQDTVIDRLQQQFPALNVITVDQISVAQAVKSYFFNSQLVTLSDNRMALISPAECQRDPDVKQVIEALLAADNPIQHWQVIDCRESMRNGGGPACLRLRVVLTKPQLQAVNANCRFSDAVYQSLLTWAEKYYRDRLTPQDLLDPEFSQQAFAALDELTQRLDLGSIYPFQC